MLACVGVSLWPHSRLIVDLVFITAIPGTIAAIVWSLTFWPKARVQIGRLKLRYKVVRRTAGIAALTCLPFLLLQQASIYFQGPNVLRGLPGSRRCHRTLSKARGMEDSSRGRDRTP